MSAHRPARYQNFRIAIVNVGPHDDADRMGERTYGVRINEQVITPLRHRRSDSLGRCLLAASKAVEKQKWMDVEVFPSGNDPDDNAGGKVRRTRKPSGLQNAWRRMVEDEPGEFLRVVNRLRLPRPACAEAGEGGAAHACKLSWRRRQPVPGRRPSGCPPGIRVSAEGRSIHEGQWPLSPSHTQNRRAAN
jgi:hypothetical protein